MSRQEKLADLFQVFLARLKTLPKVFSSLKLQKIFPSSITVQSFITIKWQENFQFVVSDHRNYTCENCAWKNSRLHADLESLEKLEMSEDSGKPPKVRGLSGIFVKGKKKIVTEVKKIQFNTDVVAVFLPD